MLGKGTMGLGAKEGRRQGEVETGRQLGKGKHAVWRVTSTIPEYEYFP